MSGSLRTIAGLVLEARSLLQDKVAPYRYGDDELVDAFNGIVVEVRAKRPDLFFGAGLDLRSPAPLYTTSDLTAAPPTPFPLPDTAYTACLYYMVGRSSMRDDTYADDSRATAMMNKAVSQLLQVAA